MKEKLEDHIHKYMEGDVYVVRLSKCLYHLYTEVYSWLRSNTDCTVWNNGASIPDGYTTSYDMAFGNTFVYFTDEEDIPPFIEFIKTKTGEFE